MKPLSRRSVIAGSAAVVTAIPAVGLYAHRKSDASARVEHHTRELEKAMRDLYDLEVQVLRFGPDKHMPAWVLVSANGGGAARRAANSKWLYVGEQD
jgi:hypothetical protein